MAAWRHAKSHGWDPHVYYLYRKFVTSKAESFRGRDEDCADLSIMLLIDFAAEYGLSLTFLDNAFRLYMSKAPAVITGSAGSHKLDDDLAWSSKAEFTEMVQRKIGVEALWKRNTMVNDYGPAAGDLMMIYSEGNRHHAALVYRVFGPSVAHPKWNDKNVPNFPGPDIAMRQSNVTEYFKGTVDEDGATKNRTEVDGENRHFDYLNSRGDAKRNAELIYFANARQAQDEGFEFRMYNRIVLDNWFDWKDGADMPPFSSHVWP